MEEVYDLTRLMKDNQYDVTHRGRIYQRIIKKLPTTIQSHCGGRPGRGLKSDIIFKPDMYSSVLMAVQTTKKEMTIHGPGYLYAFFASQDTMDDTLFQWMKIGVTVDHTRRMKEYRGPSVPRTMIGIYAVENMKKEEDYLIHVLDKLFAKCSKEWYQIDDTDLVQRLITKLFRNHMKLE